MKAVRCKRMRTELPSPPDITDSIVVRDASFAARCAGFVPDLCRSCAGFAPDLRRICVGVS